MSVGREAHGHVAHATHGGCCATETPRGFSPDARHEAAGALGVGAVGLAEHLAQLGLLDVDAPDDHEQGEDDGKRGSSGNVQDYTEGVEDELKRKKEHAN